MIRSDTELASNFSVSDYRKAVDGQDRIAISRAIRRRFEERYIVAVSGERRHGFTMMAISCLMIEALESFRRGWRSTQGLGKAPFCSFFNASDRLRAFRQHAPSFYRNVRCGILHQAETTGGWKIRRRGPMFESQSLSINAKLFLDALHGDLRDFCDRLEEADWDDSEWRSVREKMSAVVAGCSSIRNS
jgi:hypothetical protein